MTPAQLLAHQRRKAGVCTYCGVTPVTSRIVCVECSQRSKQYTYRCAARHHIEKVFGPIDVALATVQRVRQLPQGARLQVLSDLEQLLQDLQRANTP
jgi:hypothetical protein